jgi:hypothetical protein
MIFSQRNQKRAILFIVSGQASAVANAPQAVADEHLVECETPLREIEV